MKRRKDHQSEVSSCFLFCFFTGHKTLPGEAVFKSASKIYYAICKYRCHIEMCHQLDVNQDRL